MTSQRVKHLHFTDIYDLKKINSNTLTLISLLITHSVNKLLYKWCALSDPTAANFLTNCFTAEIIQKTWAELALRVRVHSHRHECESEYPYTGVPRNTSLHVFQWWPFTLIRVLYEYRLPVNFTRTSSFCVGRVFVQPVWSEQHKFVLIEFIQAMMHIWRHKLCRRKIVHY